MSVSARVEFEAKGFGPDPEKPIAIALEVKLDLPAAALSFKQAKELLVRMAIMMTNPDEHEQLARDLSEAAPASPAGRRAAALRRIK